MVLIKVWIQLKWCRLKSGRNQTCPAEQLAGTNSDQEWLLTWFEWHTWNHSIPARIKTRSGSKPGLPNEALIPPNEWVNRRGAVITQSGHSWSGKSGRSLITRIALSRSPVTTPTANPVSFLLFYLRIISHAPFPFLFLLAPGCQRFGPRSIFWSLSFFLFHLRVVGCLLLYPTAFPSVLHLFFFMIWSTLITSQKKDASIK